MMLCSFMVQIAWWERNGEMFTFIPLYKGQTSINTMAAFNFSF